MRQIRHYIIVWTALVATACLPTRPPFVIDPPARPAMRAWALTVASAKTGAALAGVGVRLDAGGDQQPCAESPGPCVTNPDGYLLYPAIRVGAVLTLHVSASGFNDATIAVGELTADRADARVALEPRIVVPDTPRLRVAGKSFVRTDGQRIRLVLASELSVLRRTPAERDADLDQWASLGFDGIRDFAGRLGWAGQSAALARANLPDLHAAAKARGLYVLTAAITDSGEGDFDIEAHLGAIDAIARQFDNAILEVANEPFHPTQAGAVRDFAGLCATAKRILGATPVPWALGAADVDEPDLAGIYPTDCGPWATSHLDRSRDLLNQVRRVREIRAIVDAIGKPVGNTEPLGAAEIDQPGRRGNQPWWFFALGVLNAGFGVSGVFHSEDGLNARPLGPTQLACARAFVAGARFVPADAVFDYRNTGWANSPIRSAKFTDAGGPIVRAYSFIESGDQAGYATIFHVPDTLTDLSAIELTPGWHVVKAMPSMAHTTILRIERDRALEPPHVFPNAA